MTESTLSRLGKYEIRATLGRGAMGTVYEGWDPIIARRVAIKTVALPDAADAEAQEELDRFKREAQAAGRLQHPNIVGVFDYGETAELAYIVMEFVDGRSWKSMFDSQERLKLPDLGRVMGELLAGLQYSHERGVVHRDIKPANLILTQSGQTKIADFGIARIESSSMTQAGTVMGTPAYMSPEQFMGQTVDARTDIYSAGVVLYQLLTGERPFEGSMTAIMHKALNTQPSKPSELSVTAPAVFDAVVARAMAKRPEDRYPSATAFAEDLRAALAGAPTGAGVISPSLADMDATMIGTARSAPPLASPRPAASAQPAPPQQAGAGGGARSGLIAAGVAAVLAVAGGGAWLAMSGGKPAPAPAPVEQHASAVVAPASAVVALTLPPPPPPSLTPPSPPPATPVVAVTPPAPPPPDQTPLPQPRPAAVQPVPAPPPRAMTQDAVRKAVAAALAATSCTMTSLESASPGGVTVSGMAGRDAPEEALARAVTAAAPGVPATWHLATFDGPYCGVLDALRPLPPGLRLSLADNRTRLMEDDRIVPRLNMPDYSAYLQIDYFASDGTVAHVHHATPDGKPAFPANSVQSFDVGGAGEPFGRDMIIAVATSAPLFPQIGGPESEPAVHYLPELQAALDAARKRGVRLSAAALLLDTEPKH